ncbi:hypothetical protein C2S52_023071 [Perilla frutescens var. hirtella]|nr:hypothetical protein C2S52_023071 [Perilla frutescens var. hirtella]
MADRFYEYVEFEQSSYSRNSIDDYEEEEEEEEMCGDYGEEEVNDFESDEKSEELACPFCSEDFDVLGLCCHIDADHRMEVKPGICPFCTIKVRINMASHVITQHENVLKISFKDVLVFCSLFVGLNLMHALCIKKHRNTRSRSTIFQLRKDLQDKHLRSIKESPCVESSSDAAADSKLLSFVNNPRHAHKHQTDEAASLTEASTSVENSKDDSLDSALELCPS